MDDSTTGLMVHADEPITQLEDIAASSTARPSQIKQDGFIEMQLDRSVRSDNLPRVLVVDDDVFNVEVIQVMLQDKGIESDSAAGGLEALGLVKERIRRV